MIPWLDADAPFPPVHRALREPNGLLAAGGTIVTVDDVLNGTVRDYQRSIDAAIGIDVSA